MSDALCLTNQFLIAMPGLADPNFFQSVTYICEHNRNGAMGIVINHPVDLTLGEVVDYLGIDNTSGQKMGQFVFRGGPVETERGFVLHHPVGKWESTLSVTSRIGLSTSNDIVEALAKGEGPDNCLVALGYASWGAGQLEQELADNAWITCAADEGIIFHTDIEKRWHAAVNLVGIDLSHLSGDVGHA